MLLAALAALAVLVLAACGGGDGGSSSAGQATEGSVPAGATLVPADAFLMFTVNTDFESEQWAAVESIAEKFPGGADLIANAAADLSSEGLDFELDVQPALGPELDLVILDLPLDDSDPTIALLTQPTDPAALEALLSENDSGDPPVWREVDGWYVLADSDAIIDQMLLDASTASLADDPVFTDVIQGVSGDAALRAYVSGQVVSQIGAAASEGSDQVGEVLGDVSGIGGSAVDAMAFGLRASDAGVTIEGLIRSAEPLELETYEATITEVVPGPTIAYISFQDLRTAVESFLDLVAEQSPDFDMQVGQLETLTGITVNDDILPLFEGEHALFVRSDSPTPQIGLVLSPADAEQSLETLNQLVALLSLSDDSGIERGEATVGDIQAKTITTGDTVVYLAAVDDRLVITNSETGLADFGSGSPLSEDPAFREATDAAGMPDETAGFVFLDIRELRQFAVLVPGVEIDTESLAQLEPIIDVLVWSEPDGDDTRLAGLVRIE